MRHTRIIATVGPSCDTPDTLDALIRAGVDVFRLNFSHGTHDSHRATFTRIREAASRADRIVAVLQDLSGPKIRTGRLAGGAPIPLQGRRAAAHRHRRRGWAARHGLHDVRSARSKRHAGTRAAARRWPGGAAGRGDRRHRDRDDRRPRQPARRAQGHQRPRGRPAGLGAHAERCRGPGFRLVARRRHGGAVVRPERGRRRRRRGTSPRSMCQARPSSRSWSGPRPCSTSMRCSRAPMR